MEPDLREGDLVFCFPRAEHEQGMVAVYRLVDGDCGVKIIESDGDDIVLVPRNPRHRTRRVHRNDITRLARVVWRGGQMG